MQRSPQTTLACLGVPERVCWGSDMKKLNTHAGRWTTCLISVGRRANKVLHLCMLMPYSCLFTRARQNLNSSEPLRVDGRLRKHQLIDTFWFCSCSALHADLWGLAHLQSTGLKRTSRCARTHTHTHSGDPHAQWKKHGGQVWFRCKSVRSAWACHLAIVTATFGLTTVWESVMSHDHSWSFMIFSWPICFHSWHITAHHGTYISPVYYGWVG